jgi:DNA-binding response OmpR family regulator
MGAGPATPETISVLVVTDDLRVRDEIRYGSPAHVDTHFVADARQAWQRLHEAKPTVVVVDIQTGSAGGYGLARDMRADPKYATTPILMLLERQQDGWLARQAGASVWRTKPVEISELIDEVLALTERSPRDGQPPS